MDTPVPSLRDCDLTQALSRKEGEARLEAAQKRLVQLRLQLGGKLGDGAIGPPVCWVFEGWDASGKGGAIKRLVMPMDPRHVRVAQIAAPTDDELRHHWLQRFWPVLPGWGGAAVLDRSWYGRVLVERVEGFASTDQWRRAFVEIVDFERSLAAEGMVLIKLWMHISHDEQLARFTAREGNSLKRWKLTDEDWRNREKRRVYEIAVEEMLARTSWRGSPWHVVPAESKRFARVEVIERSIDDIEAGMRLHGMEPLPPVEPASD
jgi:polyphosphate kinase 2 (PPK2 family)